MVTGPIFYLPPSDLTCLIRHHHLKQARDRKARRPPTRRYLRHYTRPRIPLPLSRSHHLGVEPSSSRPHLHSPHSNLIPFPSFPIVTSQLLPCPTKTKTKTKLKAKAQITCRFQLAQITTDVDTDIDTDIDTDRSMTSNI
jgi:hypothetical protein